ncbi:MAG TPA: outer membrane beta-barrel protein [Adhaeribacter sp.]|nr:outer membrane beta-barrel protein [Adhaeribacter sp.]
MKKLIVALITFLLFSVPETFAQTAKSGVADKLWVGFTFSPDHGFRQYASQGRLGERTKELPALGFTTGLNALYQVNNRFALETGILLSNKAASYEIENPDVNALVAGTVYKTNSWFLDVPLKGNLYLINGDFQVYLTAGAAASFFLSEERTSNMFYRISQEDSVARVEVKSETGSFGTPALNLSTFVGAGLAFNLSDNLAFRAEPIYRRTNLFGPSSGSRSYLGAYGLNLGLLWKL